MDYPEKFCFLKKMDYSEKLRLLKVMHKLTKRKEKIEELCLELIGEFAELIAELKESYGDEGEKFFDEFQEQLHSSNEYSKLSIHFSPYWQTKTLIWQLIFACPIKKEIKKWSEKR